MYDGQSYDQSTNFHRGIKLSDYHEFFPVKSKFIDNKGIETKEKWANGLLKVRTAFTRWCVSSLRCRYRRGTYEGPCCGCGCADGFERKPMKHCRYHCLRSKFRAVHDLDAFLCSYWFLFALTHEVKLKESLLSPMECLIGKWAVTNLILQRHPCVTSVTIFLICPKSVPMRATSLRFPNQQRAKTIIFSSELF